MIIYTAFKITHALTDDDIGMLFGYSGNGSFRRSARFGKVVDGIEAVILRVHPRRLEIQSAVNSVGDTITEAEGKEIIFHILNQNYERSKSK